MDYLEFIARVTSHIPDKGQGCHGQIYLTSAPSLCYKFRGLKENELYGKNNSLDTDGDGNNKSPGI